MSSLFGVDVSKSLQHLVDELGSLLLTPKAVIDNLIEELVAEERLGGNKPPIFSFIIVNQLDDVGVV